MLLIAFGTRPEWIKIQPLIPLLKKENIPFRLLHIGQHKDLVQIDEPHELMDIYDISSDRITNIQLNVIDQADNWLKDCTAVMIQGDTTSAFSLALAAFNRKIKIIHLEAGLRTFDRFNPYPEEFNRRAISIMADINLCPTNANAQNLVKEGVRSVKYVVGNTVLDTVDTTPIESNNSVLVTLHRRENWKELQNWFQQINKLARDNPETKFLIVKHANPNIDYSILKGKHIYLSDPLDRNSLIQAIKRSILIISDSGGIQEEACYLRKKIIICRKVTERQESIWLNATLCKTPEYLPTAFDKMMRKTLSDYVCPFGDGHASENIIQILKRELQ